jgi:hypothetical protein
MRVYHYCIPGLCVWNDVVYTVTDPLSENAHVNQKDIRINPIKSGTLMTSRKPLTLHPFSTFDDVDVTMKKSIFRFDNRLLKDWSARVSGIVCACAIKSSGSKLID